MTEPQSPSSSADAQGPPADYRGLGSAQAEAILAQCGRNVLPDSPPPGLWWRVLAQLRSPLIYILIFALVFDLAVWWMQGADHWPVEAIAIFAILALNAALGTFQEYRSEQALSKLKSLAAPMVWICRDGKFQRMASSEIVPGDLVRVSSGERVPADGQISVGEVLVDEAVLTGESLPVEKVPGTRLYSGTLLVRGHGQLVVSDTGSRSSMGKLASLLENVRAEPTPLEQRLRHLGMQIARWVGGLAVALALVGVFLEGLERAPEIIIFAVALAVAAVPEGMPAVVTLVLALGVQRMAKRKAVVRRLSAVEALGSVTVIATDKTGTLTENRMRVARLDALNPGEALLAMVFANEADPASAAGDPLDRGLLDYATEQHLDPLKLRQDHPRCSSRPFDSIWKYTRVSVRGDGGVRSYLKGAPESILARCELGADDRAHWEQAAERSAFEGHRVLALACGKDESEEALEFLGLVHLWDPPRPEVPGAIAEVRKAGVRVIMITGDHPGTAAAIAREIGIDADEVMTGAELDQLDPASLQQAAARVNVFARVRPEHKLRLVQALQAAGEFVAMTGDGVNDAPALKQANVGIAMGLRGSDVSREVADLVLLDDNFATIVGAIEEGRGIYANIQSFIRFLFSTNLALVLLVVFGAGIAFIYDLREANGMLLLPLTALQLLWINLIADGPPALALTMDRNLDVMSRPPRAPGSPLLDPASARFVVASGAVKAVAGAGLLVGLPMAGHTPGTTRTAVFLFESLAQLVFAYPSRSLHQRPARNWVLNLVILATVVLQLATVLVPELRVALGLEPVSLELFALITATVLATWMLAVLVRRWAASARNQ